MGKSVMEVNGFPVEHEIVENTIEVTGVTDLYIDEYALESSTPLAEENTPTLPKTDDISVKEEEPVSAFDPMSIQNALSNDECEGGVVPNTTASHTLTSGSDGFIVKEKTDTTVHKYTLSGFTILSENGTVFKEVNKQFRTIEEAKAVINGSTYIHIVNNEIATSSIVSGTPAISDSELERAIHINGSWSL